MKEQISYNQLYITKNGEPWFPVMGEMHFTRYRDDLWEESLRKIKAGGVTIVSSYLIWIHHEEEEGVFDFTGSRNVRKFVETCKKVGIKAFLRLGPWVHGEVRNGGFPDWVVELGKQGVDLRSNDEKYLFYVRRYWEKIYSEIKDLLEDEDSPVIGYQIENEYGHVGGYTGEKGEAHMRKLTELAKEIGFKATLYTATGWGGAVIGDCLPVMGGYCEAPWDQSIVELAPNTNYIISHERNDALIACDHHVDGAVTFDESKYPYLTAELGGGLQVTGHRRPVATGKDIGAMTLTKLASGVALLGYYMYHGGSNPKGKLSTLQESRASGYANDLPEINYDFNAPIRQYGTVSDNLKEIKLLALFLNDFGKDIATLPAEIEKDNIKPSDLETLRTSVRHDDKHGYVFFNNYQRHHEMKAHRDVVFVGKCKDETVTFPKFDVESGAFGFFPYNMELGDAVLESALSTPLCKLDKGSDVTYVFYGDCDPQFKFKNEWVKDIINISREDALNAWKVKLDRDYLVISDNFAWEEDGELKVTGGSETVIKVFPELKKAPAGFEKAGTDKRFTVYKRCVEASDIKVSVKASDLFEGINESPEMLDENSKAFEIEIDYPADFDLKDRSLGKDYILNIPYAGYKIDIYCDGEKVNDHLYTGQILPISLGYLNFPKKLSVKIAPLYKDSYVYLEKWPELLQSDAGGRSFAAKIDVKEINVNFNAY